MKAALKLVTIIFLVSSLVITLRHFTERKVITETILAMGTTAKITIVIGNPAEEKVNSAYKAIVEAFTLLKTIEQSLSFYLRDGELQQINKNAGHAYVKISDLMQEVLEKSLVYSKLTDGAFDVTATSLQKEGGYGSIVLNAKRKTVYFKNKKTKIDLGGIATGFAIDKIAEHFKRLQIEDYLIDVGGDVYAQGLNKNGEPWQVGVRNPVYQDRVIKKFSITNLAVTTSGNYVKRHIVDPHSGKLAGSSLLSVSVIASTCLDADVLATAFFVMGIEKSKAFISSERNDIKALFIVDKQGSPKIITCNWD
ncbi:MAG: FAD:protein FMN transferase [Candidatus Omnitrophota bacterium]